MVGPVFALELQRERRHRRRVYAVGLAYAAFLGLQVIVPAIDAINSTAAVLPGDSPLSAGRMHALIVQHFALVALLTPALTATAFSKEKARGTLADLFTTALTSAEIVLGKLLARSLRVVEIVLYGLPVLCAAGAYVGLPAEFFVALLIATLLVILGIASAGLVAAVMSRHASGAVLGTYLMVGAGALAIRWVPLPALDPFRTLEPCWGQEDMRLLLRHLLEAALAWLALTAACLAWAVWRLRPAGLRQTIGVGPKWLPRAPKRPPVGDDPIRWQEYHIDGLAPLPALRRVPRWLAVPTVCLAPVAAALLFGFLAGYRVLTPRMAATLLVRQAILFPVLASLVVVVRCAGAVTGERERQTFDSLRLTPLDGPAFVRGKLRGVLDASLPYYGAYALPMLLLSLGNRARPGAAAFIATLASLLITWPVMYSAAACALKASAFGRTTWRSLVWALLSFYGYCVLAGFVVSALGTCVFGCLAVAPLRDYSVGGWLVDLLQVLPLLVILCAWAFSLVKKANNDLSQAGKRVFETPREATLSQLVQRALDTDG